MVSCFSRDVPEQSDLELIQTQAVMVGVPSMRAEQKKMEERANPDFFRSTGLFKDGEVSCAEEESVVKVIIKTFQSAVSPSCSLRQTGVFTHCSRVAAPTPTLHVGPADVIIMQKLEMCRELNSV